MKEIVVVSGKGGTGKTSLVAAFAALAERKILVDCDVDAADLHLVLNPRVESREDFSGGKKAFIRGERCTGCGKCLEVCRFGAVAYREEPGGTIRYAVDPISCEGCGLCARLCPAEAVRFEPVVSGQWFVSTTAYGPMVHARLGIAQANSGKLVSLLRREARTLAEKQGLNLMIADGSPGIGCPVIASITGADLVVAVTEPTCSGLHDLNRVVDLTAHFRIPLILCINKWDIHPEMADRIEKEMEQRGVRVAGRIRYDPAVTRAQIMKTTVVEYTGGAISMDIRAIWRQVIYALG
ncbi:MAG: ATP-binding protein [Deltaproteobacteria bacterium]|nr:ATP-binding protein [Deltaproteobacteria bacterium]